MSDSRKTLNDSRKNLSFYTTQNYTYLIQKLNIAVIHKFGDHGDIRPVDGALSLEHYGWTQGGQGIASTVV